jgi:hypothetical protein
MKHVLIATAALVAATVAAATAGATSASAPPCVPKLQKLNGKPVVYECGPATATLRTGGRTYSFSKGFCQKSKSAGISLQLDVGVLATFAKGNAGKAYLAINVAKIGGNASAWYGGKQIANYLVTVTGKFPTQGTFKSKVSGSGKPFSGSWNCHGVVWQAP